MKIVIIGPGAMGCLFAAHLAKSKEEVWLLDKRPERIKKIKEEGLRLEGVSGNWQAKIKITQDPKEIGVCDLIIITVKSYDTKEAIKSVKPLIGENTFVLTLQNGLGNVEIISEIVGQDKTLGGITSHGATLLSVTNIRHAGKGDTVIGRIDGKIPVQLRSIRELLNSVGFETRISKDIKAILWSKLIINVGINALTAITHLNNGKLIEFEATRKILEEAVSEAIRVAKKQRIKLIYDDPLSKVEAVCQATSNNISSMLQDVLNKKRTEIDFINGVIVRQAQALGISVPVNSTLTNLVKTIEASYKLQLPLKED